jgi:hypothetical protein
LALAFDMTSKPYLKEREWRVLSSYRRLLGYGAPAHMKPWLSSVQALNYIYSKADNMYSLRASLLLPLFSNKNLFRQLKRFIFWIFCYYIVVGYGVSLWCQTFRRSQPSIILKSPIISSPPSITHTEENIFIAYHDS